MKWNPSTGNYEKTCPVCGRGFHGRLNKVYCGTHCKSKHNNGLAAERRLRLMEVSSGVLRNMDVLCKELGDQSSKWVSIKELETCGFDLESPSQHVILSGERKGYKYGEYVLVEFSEKDQVLLTKSKQP